MVGYSKGRLCAKTSFNFIDLAVLRYTAYIAVDRNADPDSNGVIRGREVGEMKALGNIELSEFLRRPPAGEPINTHVVEATPEPKPDFEAMRKLVHGEHDSSGNASDRAEHDNPKS
jgi:hypothetical protein